MIDAKVVPSPFDDLPYKVVFSRAGKPFSQRPVTSLRAGEELIHAVLPVLRKHEGDA